MGAQLQILVKRNSKDDFTVASIAADQTQVIHCADVLEEKLKDVVYRWLHMTPEGREAWKSSGYAYNIGDLAGDYCWKPALQDMLGAAGIRGLDIHVISHDQPSSWSYDEVLGQRL